MGVIITILENIASKRNVIGLTFEDLRDIIDLLKDKTRVSIYLNIYYTFIVKYDLRSPKAFADIIERFDQTIGL